MKKILIIHSNLELGGAETSLLGLLYSLDYSRVSVDLLLYEHIGELLSLVPEKVNILPEQPRYKALMSPISVAVKQGHVGIAAARVLSKSVCALENRRRQYRDYGYIVKQRSHYYSVNFLPNIP